MEKLRPTKIGRKRHMKRVVGLTEVIKIAVLGHNGR